MPISIFHHALARSICRFDDIFALSQTMRTLLKNKAEFSNIIKQFTEDDKLDEIYKNDTGSFYPPKDRFKTKLLNYLGEAEYKPQVVIIESETNESHR